MRRFEITLINTATIENREVVHSFAWGDHWLEVLNRVSAQMKEHPEVWGGWIPEIKI